MNDQNMDFLNSGSRRRASPNFDVFAAQILAHTATVMPRQCYRRHSQLPGGVHGRHDIG